MLRKGLRKMGFLSIIEKKKTPPDEKRETRDSIHEEGMEGQMKRWSKYTGYFV